jgi:two-component system, response regulator PdtaR
MADAMRILIVDDEPVIRMGLKTILEEHGYHIVGEAADGEQAVTLATKTSPDLIFMDIKMPGLDGIAAASTIMTRSPKPIILLTAWSERDLVQRAQEAGVLAYLVKPVREAELIPAIEVAMARFQELRALQNEVGTLKETLETRKFVERAKGVLMKREGIDEQEAFLRIQRQSRNTRTPMRDIAKAILVSDELRQHSSPAQFGRVEARTPADRLRALCSAQMFVGAPGAPDLSISGVDPLAYVAPPPGHDVTLEGYVTGRTQDGEYGFGIAFGLAPTPTPGEGTMAVGCVIQNAVRPAQLAAGGTGHSAYAQLLDEVIATQQRVTVSGQLRLLPDLASIRHPVIPHLFEVHPVRSVITERGTTFPSIPLDAPGSSEWTDAENVHAVPFADLQPRTRMTLTGSVMTFRDVPPLETAYVYTTGRFHGGRSRFAEGRPFLFAFGDAAGRVRVTAVAVPDTPAYEIARGWLSSPPTGPITVVGLRTLYLPALFAPGGGRIEVILSPAFRIIPGTVRGSSTPAPTARYELVPIGGARAVPQPEPQRRSAARGRSGASKKSKSPRVGRSRARNRAQRARRGTAVRARRAAPAAKRKPRGTRQVSRTTRRARTPARHGSRRRR